jgi:hypothetical protein
MKKVLGKQCSKAVMDVQANYLAKGMKLHPLVFYREPGIMLIKST